MSQVKNATASVAVTLFFLIWTNVTHAETESPQVATDTVRSENATLFSQLGEWYREASDFHDEGKLPEAWDLYQRIWKHRKTYDVATSLGEICFQRGEFALAAHYYRITLDKMVPTQPLEFVEQVQQAFDKSRAEVAELKVSVKPVRGKTVNDVTITNVRANVVLEEPIYLEAGEHQLQAVAPRHEPLTFSVLAKPGATVEWDIEFSSEVERHEPIRDHEGLSTVRHPWIVFPIGGVVTAGLAYGAWHNARRSAEAYDLAVGLGLIPGDCDGATTNPNCQRVLDLRDQSHGAHTRAWWFGGGAVLAAAMTGIVYWLWETEVPVSVGFDPTKTYGEMRWSYEF